VDLAAVRRHADEVGAAVPGHVWLPHLSALGRGELLAHSDDPAVQAFLEGERARRAGETEAALASLALARNMAPDNPIILLAIGQAALAGGDPGTAQEPLERVSGPYGGATALHLLLAQTYLGVALPADAVKAAETALRLAPQEPRAWRLLEAARRQLGDEPAARAAAEQAARLGG